MIKPQIIFKRLSHLILLLVVAGSVQAQDCVILLHGLAKSDRDMAKLATRLTNEGYVTVNFDYPSRSASIEELAINVIDTAIDQCVAEKSSQIKPPQSKTVKTKNWQVHFVTHSMGGILVRYYLSTKALAIKGLAEQLQPKLGRVVMLGPPNNGSEAVDSYIDFPGFRQIAGPAGLQLGTGQMSIANKLGRANFELGVIAGTRSLNLMLSTMLPGQDDGKVTVASTKVDGMKDHLTLPVTHPFMMKNKKVIEQVVYFLKHGQFKQD